MPRKFVVAVLALASLTLSGCSVFYPNWGATSLPTESNLAPEISESAAPESSESTDAEVAIEPSESPSAEPTATEIKRKETTVEIIMAFVDQEAGVLQVVAQLPEIVDLGGTCTFKFIGGSVSKSLTAKAEPSSDYTQCHPIEFELKDLAVGDGVISVSYESDGYFGESAGQSVVIG
ncbi:MAG: hypothetical protein K9G13_06995 [Aquiluna sp.]|nr:hypothetical protein [Aquiluna sp.]MCF8546265.1 hypothetical protein [Aquiluna sp.]